MSSGVSGSHRALQGRQGGGVRGRPALPADLGRSELNALTPAYFSGARRQVWTQEEKKKGKRERCEEGREEPTTKASPPENSWQSCWWKSSCCAWHSCPRGSQGHRHGCLGDPGDPGSQDAPHLSSAEQMVARDSASCAATAAQDAGPGHLSSPALERRLLQGPTQQALVHS